MTTFVERGRRYAGVSVLVGESDAMRSFKRVTATRRIDAMGAQFSLVTSDKWEGDASTDFRLRAGARVRVIVGGTEERTVLEGHVEKVEVGVSGNRHEARVSGRDVTGDLVDCSPADYRDFADMALGDIAERVCRPFGIPVFGGEISRERFKSAKMRPGETAGNFLTRLAKIRGLLLCSEPASGGGLRICEAGGGAAAGFMIRPTIDSGNAIDVTVSFDSTLLFSEYVAISQSTVVDFGGSDATTVRQETSSSGKVTDPSVGRHRPLAFIAEKSSGNRDALARAKWELASRTAQAFRIRATVPGWTDPNGNLWRENTLVRVDHPAVGVADDFLVEAVAYSHGWDESQIAELTLVGKDSYKIPPQSEARRRGGFNLDLAAVRALARRRPLDANPENMGAELP